MKKIVIKYTIVILSIIYIIFITKTCLEQANVIKELKDLNTTELIQKDSLQKVHTVTVKQFKNLILKQDSLYRDVIKSKDIEIKYLNSISKIQIRDTVFLNDTIINNISTQKDTVIHFIKPIKCVTILGDLAIENTKIDLIFKEAKFDISIIVTDYYDVIYWYNFRKRKSHGYPTIGFRNHYINKTYAKAKDFGDDISVELIKIKK